jgi:hypothetical protein
MAFIKSIANQARLRNGIGMSLHICSHPSSSVAIGEKVRVVFYAPAAFHVVLDEGPRYGLGIVTFWLL